MENRLVVKGFFVVFGGTKGKNEGGDVWEEDRGDFETGTFAKVAGKFDDLNDADDGAGDEADDAEYGNWGVGNGHLHDITFATNGDLGAEVHEDAGDNW